MATRRLDEAITSYADCEHSIEELLAQTGYDDIVDYFGEDVYFIANDLRAENDVVFGTLVYNYGRDGYDIVFDCGADESECKRVELGHDDSFDVWYNGEWVSTRLIQHFVEKHWYLCDDYSTDSGLEETALEDMRVRTSHKYYYDFDYIDEDKAREDYFNARRKTAKEIHAEKRKAVAEYSEARKDREQRKAELVKIVSGTLEEMGYKQKAIKPIIQQIEKKMSYGD